MKTRILRIILAGCLSLFAGALINTKAQKAELVVQTGHTAQVHSVAVSPDGLTIASGSSDRTVKLWEATTGRLLRTLSGHTGRIFAVAFSTDSQIVASGGQAGEIKLWNRSSGSEIAAFRSKLQVVACLAFSPDRRILASGGIGSTIQFWDIQTKHEIPGPLGFSPNPISIAFSPDAKVLASVHSDLAIRIWNTNNGKLIRGLPTLRAFGRSIAFSPDGRTIAVGDVQGNIKLVDAGTAKELWSFIENSSEMASLAFSPDGLKLAAGSKMGGITILDAKIGKKIRTFTNSDSVIDSISFYPDALSIVSASFWEIKIWNAQTGDLIGPLLENSSSVNSVAFSHQGKSFAFGSLTGGIKLFRESGGELTTILPYQTTSSSVGFSPEAGAMIDRTLSTLLFRPTGEMLASEGSGVLKLWDVKTARELRSIGNTLPRTFAFNPSGKSMASGNDNGVIKIWDVGNGHELESLPLLKREVRSISFSPDGGRLAVGDGEEIRIWDARTRRVVLQFSSKSTALNPVLFSPKHEVIAVVEDSGVSLRDLATKKIWQISISGTHVQTMAFSPNGEMLAVGTWDKDVRLFDITSGKEIHRFDGRHSSSITSIAFSGDGRILASGSNDGTAKLWNIAAKKEICGLVALGGNDWVVLTPEGRFDTNKDLDNVDGLHWVVSDDPLKPVPLEIFMRDYFEPQLLPRLLQCNAENNCNQEFKPVRDISQLNRVQPPVEIRNVSTPDTEGYVNVTVEVGRGEGQFVQGGKRITRTSDVHDLRLFRDGQLVATWPYDGAQRLLAQTAKDVKLDSNLSDDQKLLKEERDWQQATRVELDANGRKTLNARVRLAQGKDAAQTEFTAYAFNENRVKSQTAKWDWPAAEIAKLPKARAIKPRAYVVTIGVNASENANWRLRYAVNDALKIRDTLSGKLKELKQADGLSYRYDVVAFPLVSEYSPDGATLKSNDATKQKIQAVFDLLAGRKINDRLLAELQASVPQVGQLRKAEPDDLILISFSSHGYTDRSGNFFILPYDIGAASEITPDLLAHCISSEELSLWLRDVDAGDMVIVIDACHAAAVTGKGFKPGPMASRGLGQLAYDKGMRILTATQANDFALESGSLGQGLLSYALVENGLREGRADFKPKPDGRITMNEWLEYGAAQVPTLYDKIKRGDLKAVGKGARAVIIGARKKRESYQQRPLLFDFARKRGDPIISVKAAAKR
jgi:WD40 repeat protein/uncharacterized caspase-like protein